MRPLSPSPFVTPGQYSPGRERVRSVSIPSLSHSPGGIRRTLSTSTRPWRQERPAYRNEPASLVSPLLRAATNNRQNTTNRSQSRPSQQQPRLRRQPKGMFGRRPRRSSSSDEEDAVVPERSFNNRDDIATRDTAGLRAGNHPAHISPLRRSSIAERPRSMGFRFFDSPTTGSSFSQRSPDSPVSRGSRFSGGETGSNASVSGRVSKNRAGGKRDSYYHAL